MNKKYLAVALAILLAVPVALFAQTQTDVRRWGGQNVVRALCDDHNQIVDAPINVSSTGSTQIIALTSGQRIYICGYDIIAGGTVNVTFREGDGTNCNTNTVSKTGAYPLTAQTGLVRSVTGFVQWKTTASRAFCLNLDAAVQVSGIVTYVKFT